MKKLFRRSKPPPLQSPPSSEIIAVAPLMSNSSDLAPRSGPIPTSDPPIIGKWDSAHTTIAAGVAIFHLATSRVVLCYHPVEKYWFLPKGRRDVGEDTGAGAEREGFEEVRLQLYRFLHLAKVSSKIEVQSGYRNRLLPLPIPTRQPKALKSSSNSTTIPAPFSTEPVWTQLAPVSHSSQYILFWYIAETLPPHLENQPTNQTLEDKTTIYQTSPKFEAGMTLKQRIEMDGKDYEPVRHQGTGVNADELLYESHLLPVEEAIRRLGRGVSADVVRKGWEGICQRRRMEEGEE